ncbi:MAG: CfrBI family restriction endonuclease [Anaerolineales bacterium]|nr:CfrBI family restriction endonuclease [Anaerolineales bacterium]
MSSQSKGNNPTLDQLFPAGSRVLLTGTGKQFIERIGVETVREVVLRVLMGENIRTQTEPLTRQRIAQISGAIVALFAQGLLQVENFTQELSNMAVQQLATPRKNDKTSVWLAQWILGLTDKSVQNVLRGKSGSITEYITDFERAIEQAAERCRADIGDLRMTLGYIQDPQGRQIELDWKAIARLTTAIGSQTLTIRGSDKSMFGKLFERLVLGSFLTILGFQRVNPATNTKLEGVFWLSDNSDLRESDATLLFKPGKLARFDIGFIGPGNSEISKDKLTRYAREIETIGSTHSSVTFIVVDRLPETSKTKTMAEQIEAEIVQMSMQYWPRQLAQKLGDRFSFKHELQTMPDDKIQPFLKAKLSTIAIQDFISSVSLEQLQKEGD